MGWRLSPMRIQREGAQLQIRGTWSAGPGDDQARFLADLRALRDSAAIGYDELAARAHYPSDVLKEAENGPLLPGLPILTAYVRACEGDVLDWEERWRRLNPEVADDPDLPVRPAGASPAAVAGARAGVGVGAPDVYDPERIRAALRGDHVRSGQASRRANDQGIAALAPVPPARRAQRRTCSWIPARAGTAVRAGGPARAGTRPPTRASPRPTGTTRPSTPAAGRSTPRSPSCRIPPSAPNPRRTRTSPGSTTANRNPGRPNRPTAATRGRSGRTLVWRRSRRPSRHRSPPAPNGYRGIRPTA